jgi:ABC-type transport system involved in cytochrome c biogenesis permease subunit
MPASTYTIWTRIVAVLVILTVIVTLFFFMVKDMTPKGESVSIKEYTPWEKETVSLMDTLVLRDGGRVKPFSSYAQFSMLRLRGDRKIELTLDDGKTVKLRPSEWLMDCLFRPQFAIQTPSFRVDNAAVIESIGLKSHGRRDRYTYKEIEPGVEKLFELAQSYEKIDEKKRDAVQKMSIDLAYNVRNYQFLISYFAFARGGVEMKAANPDGSSRFTDFSTVMGTAPMILQMAQESQETGSAIPENLQSLLQQVLDGSNYAKYGLLMIPPDEREQADWRSAGDRIMDVMSGNLKDPTAAIADTKALELLARKGMAPQAEFRTELSAVVDRFSDRAKERGEYRAINAENIYNRKNFTLNAMVCFLLAMLVSIGMWFLVLFESPKISTKITYGLSLGLIVIGLAYMFVGIGMRSYIMWRPPVGNLYDTIIFICAVAVGILLAIEYFVRERVALTLCSVLGLALVLLARRYEVGDAKDHMDPLVAVLNSNYWLTTHVITITMGYAAGLLTAFLSMSYVVMRALGLGADGKRLLRLITGATYGGLLLTLFLSLVGTVLGGVWANDSWGRFWGWDPKENGALMIVLWSLIMLHARLGGIIRDWGFHLASIFMSCIVSFSWWHVNFLGEGLHNYGFTSGKGFIWIFYGGVMSLIFFGICMWLAEKIKDSNDQADKNKDEQKPVIATANS